MIVTCKNCKARFNIDENIIKAAGTKFRCSKCSYVFIVYRSVHDHKPPRQDKTGAGKWTSPAVLDKIITISNQKGGVAKTTTCLNLGTSLTLLKKRVLMIDFDVQANLTFSLGYQNRKSFYDALCSGPDDLSRIIVKTKYPGLWLMPSNKNMALLNRDHFGAKNYEYLLRDRLKLIKEQYDHVLIDTPPSIEFLAINALTCSNLVIIPIQCEYLSAHGADQVVRMINVIRKKTNPGINFRILITMYDETSSVSKLIFSKLEGIYKDKIFKTVIGLDGKVRESQVMNMPVIYYDKRSSSGLEYVGLAREMLKK